MTESIRDDSGESKARVRDWPKLWARDEKFWREAATRTIPILLSGLIVLAVGVTAGLIDLPVGRVVVAC